MKTTTKLIRIGNSRGVRLPQAVLKEAHLTEAIEIETRGDELVLRAARHPREGWEGQAAELALREQADAMAREWREAKLSSWDDNEWTW